MTGKEKLYFLLNRIDNIKELAPKGKLLKIHATSDLNSKFRDDELELLFAKLEKDEKVLKVIKVGDRRKEAEGKHGLGERDDGCYHIKPLPLFDEYFLKIQHEFRHYEFTGENMRRRENPDKSGENKEEQIECSGLFYSFQSNKLIYADKEKIVSPENREIKFFLTLYRHKGQTVDYKTIAREAGLPSYKDLSEDSKINHEDLHNRNFSEDASLLKRDFREIALSLGMPSKKFLKMIKTVKKKGYHLVCQ